MAQRHLPFATLGVRVIREKHGQEFHEVSTLRPLFALWSQRSAADAGRVDHWQKQRGNQLLEEWASRFKNIIRE